MDNVARAIGEALTNVPLVNGARCSGNLPALQVALDRARAALQVGGWTRAMSRLHLRGHWTGLTSSFTLHHVPSYAQELEACTQAMQQQPSSDEPSTPLSLTQSLTPAAQELEACTLAMQQQPSPREPSTGKQHTQQPRPLDTAVLLTELTATVREEVGHRGRGGGGGEESGICPRRQIWSPLLYTAQASK